MLLPMILISSTIHASSESQFELDVIVNNMTINNIIPDFDFMSVVFEMEVNDNAWFDVTFPREFFDSIFNGVDDDFVILGDGDEILFIETLTNSQSRTVHIPILKGVKEIEIVGSYVNGEVSNTFPISNINNYPHTTLSLTITTNNSTYHEGNPISISGQFNNSHNGTSLSISLQSPNGHLSPVHNIINNNNNYSTTIPTGNNTTILIPGIYTLTTHYGNQTASVSFDYHLNSIETEEEYFVPTPSYLTLSDRDISKWNKQLTKWQNAQNRTDNNTEFYYEKLDEAISKNQTNKINLFTERIGHSLALSSLYDGIIQCLQEQLDLLS